MHLSAVGGLGMFVAAGAMAQNLPDDPTLVAARRLLIATHFVERNLPPPDVKALVEAAIVDCMADQIDKGTKQADCRTAGVSVERAARTAAETYPARKARLFEAAVHIYARHFSRDDMDRAAQFYESPTGQHLFAETDRVAREFRAAQFDEMAKVAGDLPPPTASNNQNVK